MKETIFTFDEEDELYTAELNGVAFECSEASEEQEELAKQLADAYEKKLPDVIAFMLPDIEECFDVSDAAAVKDALGKPLIDLDAETITYLEQTFDDEHIIEVEFGGIFEEFYGTSIDG